MPRVICTLANASTLINGVNFTASKGQMLSDDIPDDVAAAFAEIPGYQLVAKGKASTPPPAPEGTEPSNPPPAV